MILRGPSVIRICHSNQIRPKGVGGVPGSPRHVWGCPHRPVPIVPPLPLATGPPLSYPTLPHPGPSIGANPPHPMTWLPT
ncbi:hypothetical protein HanRHA438_Chr13g0603121 [Helianthus annuus]|nr:hypothetical protein HanRHA438_Chr13g0603121 [Helianthus annuus]